MPLDISIRPPFLLVIVIQHFTEDRISVRHGRERGLDPPGVEWAPVTDVDQIPGPKNLVSARGICSEQILAFRENRIAPHRIQHGYDENSWPALRNKPF